jgi:hypothetical protein
MLPAIAGVVAPLVGMVHGQQQVQQGQQAKDQAEAHFKQGHRTTQDLHLHSIANDQRHWTHSYAQAESMHFLSTQQADGRGR